MRSRIIVLGSLVMTVLFGCASSQKLSDEEQQRRMLGLLMPKRIEIVEPFTRVTSFDGDTSPDGIEVLLQAVNSLEQSGLMMAGHVRVGLYEFVPASAERKGRRLQHWDVPLTTREEQLRHWNDITQMYELLLKVDPSSIPLADEYVLQVTYNSPLGEHLTDECLVSYRPTVGPLGRSGESG